MARAIASKKQHLNDAVVYIVDDDKGLRKALSLLIKTIGYKTKECATASEFLQCHDENRPACLLLDVRMPEMSGLELQQILAEEKPDIPVVIMTGHADVAMAVQAMKNGAMDFIEKPFHDQQVLTVIQRCLTVAEGKQQKRALHVQSQQILSRLTPREREILQLLAEGNSNKHIALKLDISVRTVEVHRAHIMRKVGAKTLAELVRFASSLTI